MHVRESPANRAPGPRRARWTHRASFGAAPHSIIEGVNTTLALRFEHARQAALPMAGAALDRQKCFDYLVTDICLERALHAGCPQDIVAARRTFYQNHARYIRMAGAHYPPLQRTNGHPQGSSWSLGDIKLSMCV